MAKITNCMPSRSLIIRRPYDPSRPAIISAKGKNISADIMIAPGKCEEVDFWDKIKNHPVYQSLLDRKKIAVGEGAAMDTDHFTSFGDTLTAPANLDPESMKDEAKKDKVKITYENEPAISTKRRGRPPKSESAGDEGEGGDES